MNLSINHDIFWTTAEKDGSRKSYTNANLLFFEMIFFQNAYWFYIIFCRSAGGTNQFWGSFERSEFYYCRRILIFKEILNKIILNLRFKLGTF